MLITIIIKNVNIKTSRLIVNVKSLKLIWDLAKLQKVRCLSWLYIYIVLVKMTRGTPFFQALASDLGHRSMLSMVYMNMNELNSLTLMMICITAVLRIIYKYSDLHHNLVGLKWICFYRCLLCVRVCKYLTSCFLSCSYADRKPCPLHWTYEIKRNIRKHIA